MPGLGNWNARWIRPKTTGPVLFAKTAYLSKLLNQYGYADKFLMNTESAVLCGSTGDEPICAQDDWMKTKTYQLVQTFTVAATYGLRANVWYSLGGWRGSGLIDTYGQPASPYQAFLFNNQMLQRATPWGQVDLYQNVKGYAFQRNGKLLWILWSLDGVDHTIPLGTLPSSIYTVLGERIDPTENITITLSPVYIEW